jgi:hypothetical protein
LNISIKAWANELIFSSMIEAYTSFIFIRTCLDRPFVKWPYWLQEKNFGFSYINKVALILRIRWPFSERKFCMAIIRKNFDQDHLNDTFQPLGSYAKMGRNHHTFSRIFCNNVFNFSAYTSNTRRYDSLDVWLNATYLSSITHVEFYLENHCWANSRILLRAIQK